MASTSRVVVLRTAATLALAGAPLYWFQGRRVRRTTPRLDEAPGKRAGVVPGSAPALRIVGLGESPMAAVGLERQADGLVPQVARRLAAARGRRVEWRTAARSGATAGFTRKSLLTQLDAGGIDLAIVTLGVNDCLAMTSTTQWCRELKQLASAIRSRLDPETIIFTGVAPMRHFPALPVPLATMLGLRARLLDALLARFAESDAAFVHAPMSFAAHPDGLFCRDGFHPNESAHRLWADQVAGLVCARADSR